MKNEYHILIAWEKAAITTEQIIQHLTDNLTIKLVFNYNWDAVYAKRNYASFYGEKLENIQYKVDHCGKGNFRVFIICDNTPQYEIRSTSSGKRTVNINMFELKTLLRKMTGGGHLIHASDTANEAILNSVSLFGKPIDEIMDKYQTYLGKVNNPIDIKRNISGALGWESWEVFLNALNYCTKYVVLRNIKTILDDNLEEHGDTDLLVGDMGSAITLLAGEKKELGKERVLYSVKISGKEKLVDLRHLGDGYYDKNWENVILNNRKKHLDSNIYVPDTENQMFSLLYHALVQKMHIANDYQIVLAEFFNYKNRDDLKKFLEVFMEEHQYKYSLPKDPSVYIHPEYFEKISVPICRKIFFKLQLALDKEDNINGQKKIRYKTIFKILYKKYYLVITTLRKFKTRIRSFRNN